jgi:hypothetical protein
VPPCTSGLCSNLYHSQDQVQLDSCNGTCDCSGVPCGEYLWDHRNASLRDWIVNEHVMGAQVGLHVNCQSHSDATLYVCIENHYMIVYVMK